jgi:hypothetical protein
MRILNLKFKNINSLSGENEIDFTRPDFTNEGLFAIGIFLDLKKAFDVCSHTILLKKLAKMGINGMVANWFTSYLNGRTQCVDINGTFSDPLAINISVIQGSILGPILFLCYINDIWRVSTLLLFLFADDTAGMAKGKKLSDLVVFVNAELQKIANWLRANKMAVNIDKTKYIIFRNRGQAIDNALPQVVFNFNEIGYDESPEKIFPLERVGNAQTVQTYKLLGVLFDEHLTFEPHINTIKAKISKSLFCISRLKNFLPASALRTLYFSLVHPHLLYCINIYSMATKTKLNELFLMQKKAVRIVCSEKYNAHTAPLFRSNKMLPLHDLITYHRLKFMHRFSFSKQPSSFDATWTTNFQLNPNLVLRNVNNYVIPRHRIELFKRSPLISLPTTWNACLADKSTTNEKIFLKTVRDGILGGL